MRLFNWVPNMTKTKKVMLSIIYSIAFLLWMTLLIMVLTHKENKELMEYDSSKMEEALKNMQSIQGVYSDESSPEF